MKFLRSLPFALAFAIAAPAQQTVTFATNDGGQICADLFGQSSTAVVLAHGGQFNKSQNSREM